MGKIDIKEVIEDKNSWFNIKRIHSAVGNVDEPIKTFDIKNITKANLKTLSSESNRVFEANKLLKHFDDIKLIESGEDVYLNHMFCHKGFLSENPSFLNVTLSFNPFDSIRRIEDIDYFFKYYYEYSKSFLFVPNVMPLKSGIGIQNYINFVNESKRLLAERNNKPIFMPISINFTAQEINQLLSNYVSNENYYFWVDFEGKAITAPRIARLKIISTFLKNKGIFDKVYVHSTNIKREILSNMKNDLSASSDILASLCGINCIGVNREPQRYFAAPSAPTNELVAHKSRLFNKDTYYYEKLKVSVPEKDNKTKNSLLLKQEIHLQAENFLAELDMTKYIVKKPMITNENSGALLEALSKSTRVIQRRF